MKLSMLPIAVGVSLASGAALGLLYLIYKKDDEIQFGRRRPNAVTTTRAITINVKIPKDAVGIVIGRGGANIREIQEQTKTSINFKDEAATENYRMCVINGSPANAQYAESLIHDIIRNQPLITTSEIRVPSRACGRIIGRSGETIRGITQASGAKVTLDSSTGNDKFGDRRIVIKGTVQQIAVAKSLITEKVEEDVSLRKKCEEGASNRTPRTNKGPQYLTAGNKQEADESDSHGERLNASSSGGMMEVYVSAVETPDRFWVQVVSPSAVELDQLLVQMTEYYSKDENQELHVIENLSIGQYVAAPFMSDEKWYRAQVVSVEANEYAPEQSQVELYYVDYGDTHGAPRKVVLELRADFLKLTFQAIECSLANVKPKGGEWSDEASDLFEDLTYNAKWKVMMCNIDHYDSERSRGQDRGRREGSPVPVVNLFDINGAKDINVADELVKNQFAVYSTAPVVKRNVKTTNWVASSSELTMVSETSANSSSAPSNRSKSSDADAAPTLRKQEESACPSTSTPVATNGHSTTDTTTTAVIDNNKMFRKINPVFEDEMELY